MIFIEDMQWVDEHYLELQQKYPNKFIVVKKGKVIAIGDNYREADQGARDKLDPEEKFIVERIETGELFVYTI